MASGLNFERDIRLSFDFDHFVLVSGCFQPSGVKYCPSSLNFSMYASSTVGPIFVNPQAMRGCGRQSRKDVPAGLPLLRRKFQSADALRTTSWASDGRGACRSRAVVFQRLCERRKRPNCWSRLENLGAEQRRKTVIPSTAATMFSYWCGNANVTAGGEVLSGRRTVECRLGGWRRRMVAPGAIYVQVGGQFRTEFGQDFSSGECCTAAMCLTSAPSDRQSSASPARSKDSASNAAVEIQAAECGGVS